MGLCQLDPKKPISKFLKNLLIQNPNFKRIKFKTKEPTPVFWAPCYGLFWQKGVCQTTQKEPFYKFYNICCTKSKQKRGQFYEKIANSCIWCLSFLAVSNKWGSLRIWPKWTNFELFQQLFVQNQNYKRVYFMEKIYI